MTSWRMLSDPLGLTGRKSAGAKMRREISSRLRNRIRSAIGDFLSRHPRLKKRVANFMSKLKGAQKSAKYLKSLFDYKKINLDTLYGDVLGTKKFDFESIWQMVSHVGRRLQELRTEIGRTIGRIRRSLIRAYKAGKNFLMHVKNRAIDTVRGMLGSLKSGTVANAFKAFAMRQKQAMQQFAYKTFLNAHELRAAGSVALQAFEIYMRQKITRLHFGVALLGAGGFLKATAGHALQGAAREISRQFRFLDGFISDIRNALNTGATGNREMSMRAGMYAGSARSTYYAAATEMLKAEERIPDGQNVILARRVQHSFHGCDTCQGLAGFWMPLENAAAVAPGDDCEFGAFACKCTLETQSFSREEAMALLGTAPQE